MNIGVVGNGAIGCLFAMRLFQGLRNTAMEHSNVLMLTRKQKNKNVESLQLIELDSSIKNVRFSNDIHSLIHESKANPNASNTSLFSISFSSKYDIEQPKRSLDVVLLATKSFDIELATKNIYASSLLKDGGIILSLANGMGNIELMKSAMKDAKNIRIGQGIVYDGARLEAPYIIRHTGRGKGFYFGLCNSSFPLNGKCSEEQQKGNEDKYATGILDRLEKALQSSGMQAKHFKSEQDIQKVLWSKLLVNSVINPLTAIYNIQNGSIVTDEKMQEMNKRLCKEFEYLVSKLRIKLEIENGKTYIDYVNDAAKATALNTSSMLQDVRHKRKTEIDAINGSVLRIAKQVGLDVDKDFTTNQEMYSKIKLIESNY